MANLVLEIYHAIAAASQRMREAACAGDWDALIAAEGNCAALIERARSQPADTTLAPEERRHKLEIIRRVLADDAEIRAHLQPWMKQLEELLQLSGRRRRMQRSYAD